MFTNGNSKISLKLNSNARLIDKVKFSNLNRHFKSYYKLKILNKAVYFRCKKLQVTFTFECIEKGGKLVMNKWLFNKK